MSTHCVYLTWFIWLFFWQNCWRWDFGPDMGLKYILSHLFSLVYMKKVVVYPEGWICLEKALCRQVDTWDSMFLFTLPIFVFLWISYYCYHFMFCYWHYFHYHNCYYRHVYHSHFSLSFNTVIITIIFCHYFVYHYCCCHHFYLNWPSHC